VAGVPVELVASAEPPSSPHPLARAAMAPSSRTRWPLQDRPFAEIVAWVNLELMKNAAELGYARFVLAASEGAP
jgi:hypothetical protein